MLRQLIVNADDFGCTPGVSRGILRAHREGIVTSTSVMVNMPAAAEAVSAARREAPALGLGLHLNLTAGAPVSPPGLVPDLINAEGVFPDKGDLLLRLPRLDMSQVEQELRAQVARFVELAGQPPDHLDSHHHITYLSPPMAALMMQLAREIGVPIRRPVPRTTESIDQAVRLMQGMIGGLPGRAYIEEMITILESLAEQAGVVMPDHFVGDFFGQRATLGELLLMLLDLEEGVSELMCHPAEVDDALRATSGYIEPRAAELAALTHPSTREVINSEFIQLISFRDLHR